MSLRQATSSKVLEMDDAVLARIDIKKRKFLDVKADSAAMRRAKKEAYFQYIYHTVGIEGNTLSLAQTRAILETRLAVVGKSIMEHNEILGMEAALKYINNTLIDKYGDISIQDILEIHRRVIGNVDPVEAGLFRRTQVPNATSPVFAIIGSILAGFCVQPSTAPTIIALHSDGKICQVVEHCSQPSPGIFISCYQMSLHSFRCRFDMQRLHITSWSSSIHLWMAMVGLAGMF